MNKIPSAEYALVYGVPGLKYKDKNLIAVAAHKDHLGIYPCSPSVVNEIIKNHPHIDYAKGTLRFPFENLPDDKLINEIIDLRSKEIDL